MPNDGGKSYHWTLLYFDSQLEGMTFYAGILLSSPFGEKQGLFSAIFGL